MEAYTIYHDLFIKSSLDRTFEAISEPEHLVNWWPLKCTGKVGLGEEYNLYFTDEFNWYGKVTEITPNERFVIRMTKSDEDWSSTKFGFQLEDKGGVIQVKFFHSGWKEQNEHFRIASFCWAMLLNGLKNYLEKGIIIPFEDRS